MAGPVKPARQGPMTRAQLGERICELLGLKKGDWFRILKTRDGEVMVEKIDTPIPETAEA